MTGEARRPSARADGPAALLVYLVAVFALGALIAYPLHLLLSATGPAEVPFHKIVIRTLKVLALVGLLPLLVGLGLNRREHWGLACAPRRFAHRLLGGLMGGILTMLVLVLMLVLLELRVATEAAGLGPGALTRLVLEAVLAGLAVGLIEEIWFRGALFSAIRHSSTTATAITASAVLYAAVHFIRADVPVAADSITWLSGFEVIAQSFGRFSSPATIGPLLALAAAGVLLALVRVHTGSVATCVGLHGGWVMVIKITRETTRVDETSAAAFLAAGYDGVTGYLAFGWLSVLCIAYYLMVMRGGWALIRGRR